jgi:hypothetical protein
MADFAIYEGAFIALLSAFAVFLAVLWGIAQALKLANER